MAIPTPVNGQITDAVTQSNITVLGNSPAHALSALYQVSSQAAGLAMQNATANQQNTDILANAVLTRCVSALVKPEGAA